MSVRRCLCKQDPALVREVPPPSYPHRSVGRRGPLTCARPPFRLQFCWVIKDLPITGGPFNAKPQVNLPEPLGPFLLWPKEAGLVFLLAVCSQPLMWNNTSITSRTKRQQIHFCSAVLAATYKQRHYSCPNFLLIFAVPACIVCYFLSCVWQHMAADAESIKQCRVGWGCRYMGTRSPFKPTCLH